MRRLSVAVQNTIPKSLRERIDVPHILILSGSSSGDEDDVMVTARDRRYNYRIAEEEGELCSLEKRPKY